MSTLLNLKYGLVFLLFLASITQIEGTIDGLEFTNLPPTRIQGTIPEDLNGNFYQSVVTSVQRKNGIQSCILDGDGGVFSMKFQGGKALATYKFVKSDTFIEEEKQDMILFNSICQYSPNLFSRYFSQSANRSNTRTLSLKNKLLSFYEGGIPFELDSVNLETIGQDNFNGGLRPSNRVLAHTREDETGIYAVSLGMAFMAKHMNIYKLDKDGNVVMTGNYISPDRAFSITHDFVIAGNYILIINYGVKINLYKLFFKLEPIGSCFEEDPNLKNHILIFNKETLEHVKTIEYERIFSLHYTNGFVKDNNIIFDIAEYENFGHIKKLFSTRGNYDDIPLASLFRYEINLTSWEVKRRNFYKEICEFPNVRDGQTGKEHMETLTLCLKLDKSAKIIPEVVKLNKIGEEIVKKSLEIDLNTDWYSEALFANGLLKEYVIYLTYHNYGSKNASVKAYIRDADTLDLVAILEWDKNVGRGFHAIFSQN